MLPCNGVYASKMFSSVRLEAQVFTRYGTEDCWILVFFVASRSKARAPNNTRTHWFEMHLQWIDIQTLYKWNNWQMDTTSCSTTGWLKWKYISVIWVHKSFHWIDDVDGSWYDPCAGLCFLGHEHQVISGSRLQCISASTSGCPVPSTIWTSLCYWNMTLE